MYKKQYSTNYKQNRTKICSKLKIHLIKITETLKKKMKEANRSLKVYDDLYISLESILKTMSSMLVKNKREKIELVQERTLPKYGASMIKINNKHLGIDRHEKSLLRQGSKEGPYSNNIETNMVSIRFLDSMQILIDCQRKYFIRMVDNVIKIRMINRVSNFSFF